jgi:hypothetical protein
LVLMYIFTLRTNDIVTFSMHLFVICMSTLVNVSFAFCLFFKKNFRVFYMDLRY